MKLYEREKIIVEYTVIENLGYYVLLCRYGMYDCLSYTSPGRLRLIVVTVKSAGIIDLTLTFIHSGHYKLNKLPREDATYLGTNYNVCMYVCMS